jgi:HEAT repeat protein
MTSLSQQLIEDMLLQQEVEFRSRFTSTPTILYEVITHTSESELLAAGQRLLSSDDPARRILGIRLIREVKENQAQATYALSQLLSCERNDDVIYWIVSAFGFLKSDSVIDRLRALAHHPDASVRYHVATAVANCATDEIPAESTNVLLGLCHDEDPEVRFSAVFEVGEWWKVKRDRRLGSELRRAASDTDPLVARAAQAALDEEPDRS